MLVTVEASLPTSLKVMANRSETNLVAVVQVDGCVDALTVDE